MGADRLRSAALLLSIVAAPFSDALRLHRPSTVYLRGGAYDVDITDALKEGAELTEVMANQAEKTVEQATGEAHEAAQCMVDAYERLANRTSKAWQAVKPLMEEKARPIMDDVTSQATSAMEETMSTAEEMVAGAVASADKLRAVAMRAVATGADRGTALMCEIADAFGKMVTPAFDWAGEIERVVALAGKSSEEIRAMGDVELAAHILRCVRDTRITDGSVHDLARRAKCPESSHSTKEEELTWLFAQLRAASRAEGGTVEPAAS